MGQTENRNKTAAGVPDTTQKKNGTTSAFSAASGGGNELNPADDNLSYLRDGNQGRASFHPGSTTQGGSNYGQGSGYLGPSSYKQGSETGKGTNYENEIGRFAETGTQADGEHKEPEKELPGDGREGGTETEHDEYADKERKENNDSEEDTIGIP